MIQSKSLKNPQSHNSISGTHDLNTSSPCPLNPRLQQVLHHAGVIQDGGAFMQHLVDTSLVPTSDSQGVDITSSLSDGVGD